MMNVTKEIPFDHTIILGDFVDCQSISMHAPDDVDDLTANLFGEIASANEALSELMTNTPTAVGHRAYLEGNHEQRLRRYIARQAPALASVIPPVPALLDLKETWQWVPYRQTYRLGKLHLTHDTGKAGKNAHRAAALAHMGSTIIGHTHRMAYDVQGVYGGLPYLAAMFGWLGDPKKVSYTHEANVAEWVHGFGVGYLDLATGIVHVQPVPIVNGQCVVEGRMFK